MNEEFIRGKKRHARERVWLRRAHWIEIFRDGRLIDRLRFIEVFLFLNIIIFSNVKFFYKEYWFLYLFPSWNFWVLIFWSEIHSCRDGSLFTWLHVTCLPRSHVVWNRLWDSYIASSLKWKSEFISRLAKEFLRFLDFIFVFILFGTDLLALLFSESVNRLLA